MRRIPACLPRFPPHLRHDRVVANGKSDEMGLRPRISAWLPPGLALGWLAVLATFVHRTERLLAVWAATGFLVFLVVLLMLQVRRYIGRASGTRPKTESDLNRTAEGSAATAELTRATSHRTAPLPSETEEETAGRSASDTASQSAQLATAETPAAPELRILTAAEAASVLRVDTGVIIKAISDGEFPGNRIGGHWRVDQGALTRWLQGKYKDPVGPPGSP
jgi:excisionase family DNA binding protein